MLFASDNGAVDKVTDSILSQPSQLGFDTNEQVSSLFATLIIFVSISLLNSVSFSIYCSNTFHLHSSVSSAFLN